MKKNILYLLLFILIACLVLILTLQYFNKHTPVENKLLSLIPENPQLILQFKHPDELLNKHLLQNILVKKITFNSKKELLYLMKQIDSVYRLAVSTNIQFQHYGFIYAMYSDSTWLFGMAVQQTRDIYSLKNFLKQNSFKFFEKEGNFFISNNSELLKSIHFSSISSHSKEWMHIFSKSPSPLHVYQKKDTTEVAYQVYFEGNGILLNGFMAYQNTKKYPLHRKFYPPDFSADFITITPFSIDTLFTNNPLLLSIKNNYTHQQIHLPQLNIYPLHIYTDLAEILKTLSDSVISIQDLVLFKINKKNIQELNYLYPIPADSNLYVNYTENNFSISHRIESFITYKNILHQNLNAISYFLLESKNASDDLFENKEYSIYYPVTFKMNKDTCTYNVYLEIFSSKSNKYLSFTFKVQQNPLNNQYLWAYTHTSPITKIIGTFDDHKTKTRFILIQDTAHQLTALNPNAEKLWTYPLSAPILSNIFIVDILKNNKHQLLFNTPDAVYLLDRNGKNVGKFPIRLASRISNPINVFDYDENKNYRIWFSTHNHYTYNYTLDAKLAEQFRPYYFEQHIAQSPYYISVGKSDYIILISEKGSVLGISRKGDGRFLLKNRLPAFLFDYCFDISTTLPNSYIYYCTQDGLYRLTLSDEVKKIYSFSDSILDAKFIKNSLHSTRLAILTPHQLQIYSLKGERLQSISTDTIYHQLHIQHPNAIMYFILSNANSHSLIQYDMNQTLMYSTPKIHSSILPYVCTLFNDNQNYLIYVNNNKLYINKLK